MKRRSRYRGDDIPVNTIWGLICGIIAFVCFVALIIGAVYKHGLGISSGVIGMIALIISSYGLSLNIKGIKQDENMFFTMPLIGVTLNSAMTILFVIIYIKGLIG